ncbi:MAG: GNAT family N-acetyltransferase [Pseudomonadota bacterium]
MTAIRDALPDEAENLAELWHDAWHDAHDGLVSPALSAVRDRANFRMRIEPLMPDLRVAGPPGAPSGLIRAAEGMVHLVFVARSARGTGVASALMTDGEHRLAMAGTHIARLECSVGNDRAACFYRRRGWVLETQSTVVSSTSVGEFPLPTWCFAKRLLDATAGHR